MGWLCQTIYQWYVTDDIFQDVIQRYVIDDIIQSRGILVSDMSHMMYFKMEI